MGNFNFFFKTPFANVARNGTLAIANVACPATLAIANVAWLGTLAYGFNNFFFLQYHISFH
jgi:hypothetical protein